MIMLHLACRLRAGGFQALSALFGSRSLHPNLCTAHHPAKPLFWPWEKLEAQSYLYYACRKHVLSSGRIRWTARQDLTTTPRDAEKQHRSVLAHGT